MPSKHDAADALAETGFATSRLGVSSSMMEESPSYGAWIAQRLRSHLSGHVLELGCGTGIYTGHYLNLESVERVTAMDRDEQSLSRAKTRLTGRNVDFRSGSAEELEPGAYDSIVCANVAEHVEHQGPFFGSLHRAIRPGGGVAILVPAHPSLYSRFDHEAGHYRRYTKDMLRDQLLRVGFRIDRLSYFNALGALGWFYTFKVRQRDQVRESDSRSMIRLFERFALPVGRSLEDIVSPPFGLSVIALCRKPSGGA